MAAFFYVRMMPSKCIHFSGLTYALKGHNQDIYAWKGPYSTFFVAHGKGLYVLKFTTKMILMLNRSLFIDCLLDTWIESKCLQ